MLYRTILPSAIAVASLLTIAACGSNSHNNTTTSTPPAVSAQDALATATPIKHLVVIFGENVSFDHYFATYPSAKNVAGEPTFTAATGTQTDIATLAAAGLTGAANPNAQATSPNIVAATVNGRTTTPPTLGAALTTTTAQPFRLDRS